MSPVSSLTGTPCLCGALFSGLGQAEGPALASSGRRVPLPGLVVRFVGMVEVAGQPGFGRAWSRSIARVMTSVQAIRQASGASRDGPCSRVPRAPARRQRGILVGIEAELEQTLQINEHEREAVLDLATEAEA